MSRLTQSRIDRWQRDIAKADQLVERTIQDMIAIKMTAKGGRFSHITDCIQQIRPVHSALYLMGHEGSHGGETLSPLQRLANHEAGKRART